MKINEADIRKLRNLMLDSGFVEREVGASGAFNFYFVKDCELNDSGAKCTAVVRALPSTVNRGDFHFDTTLIMDGAVLSDQLQPGAFSGSPFDFVNKRISLFGSLFNMEDFYVRNVPYDEHAARESMELDNE